MNTEDPNSELSLREREWGQESEVVFSIDRDRANPNELHLVHTILAAVSFAGIMELAGGAPKENHSIQLAVFLFAVGLVFNVFGYTKNQFIKSFLTKKFGRKGYSLITEATIAHSFIGPVGGIGSVLHYYNPWTCYGYWFLIVAFGLLCTPRGSRTDRKLRKVLTLASIATLLTSSAFLYYKPQKTESYLASMLYMFSLDGIRRFYQGRDPDEPSNQGVTSNTFSQSI